MSELKINELLSYALESGSSDLHLSVGSYPMVRINGEMKKLQLPIMDLATMESIRNEVLNKHQIEKFEERLEIDFSTALEGKGRFRVNFFNQINGLSAVFRTIPSVIKSGEELGIPPIMNKLASKDRGLVLLTGPTGSGKSTTLAAMLDYINDSKSKHIITIEDPVE
jgi:twitching motility protein PilT